MSHSCTQCGKTPQETAFCKGPTKAGLASWCKSCVAAANRAKYRASRGLDDAAVQKSREKNALRAQRAKEAKRVAAGGLPSGHFKCVRCALVLPRKEASAPRSSRCNPCKTAERERSKKRAREAVDRRAQRLKVERAAGREAREQERLLRPPPPPYVPPAEKACTQCRAVKPLDGFPPGTCRDGRGSWCRKCVNSAKREHTRHKRATDPEWRAKRAAQGQADRRASDPEMALRDAQRADHRSHVAAWRTWLTGLSARASAHVAAYRAHVKAAAKSKLEGGPKARGDLEAAAKERAKSAWRRARRIGRLAPWVSQKDTLPPYRAALRFEAETGIPWDVDHGVPLRGETVSGLHVPENLFPVPRSINQAKGRKVLPGLQ
jgi:hypothetical protein